MNLDNQVLFKQNLNKLAYTFVELLLTLILILMFFSALVFNFINLDKKEYIYEGTLETQTILKIVKSQSEISGKRFRIKFPQIIGGDDGELLKEKHNNLNLVVEWESDPIKFPNIFENF